MLQPYLSADGIRAALVFIFAIAQAIMAYWPEIRGWEQTTAKRSQNLDTLVVPFGPFFAIWIVIFLFCLGFAVWHGLPSHLSDPELRSVGWLVVLLFAGNTLWEYYVPKRGFDWGSVAIVVVELALALLIMMRLNVQSSTVASSAFGFLGTAPLYFYAGWVSVAAFVNLSSTLILTENSLNPRLVTGAGLIIAAVTLLVVAIAYFSGSWFYAGSAAWGLLGIAVGAYLKQQSEVVAIAALALLFALVAPSLSGFL